MKVAIIGAGPSGLAAAKALRDVGLSPVIFEASASLGGVWAPQNHRLWKSLHTNLSKYTCCFADFPWLQYDTSSNIPLFPSSQQVHDYLQRYAELFIPSTSFRFNSKVTQLKSLQNGKFLLSWQQHVDTNMEESDEFEKVVIASGFFSSSSSTAYTSTGTSQTSSSTGNRPPAFEGSDYFPGKVYYSSEYMNPEPFQGKEVVVVGGSFSGCEIAAEISSMAKKVYHILPSYTNVVPRYLPLHPKSPSTPFLPLDLVFYCLPKDKLEKLSNEEDTSSFEVLYKSKEEAYKTKSYLQALVGDNSYVDPLFALRTNAQQSSDEDDLRQSSVAITDRYKAMVRAGAVEVLPGRLVKCLEDGRLEVHPNDASLSNEFIASKLKNVQDLVLCTGFQPNVEDYLESTLLKDVFQYLPQDRHSPLQLYQELFHPQVPGLYFVGMYKGPYFGVIELQAKLTAKYISGEIPWPSESELASGLEKAKLIRSHLPRPQFPHSDYMGMMLDLARSLKLKPQLPDSFPILLPTSFSSTSSSSVNEEVLRELQSFQQGKHIAKAVAYALEGGKWTLYRELYDKDSQKVSVVEGNVQFHRIHSDAGAGKVQAGSCGIDGEGSCGNTADTPVLPTTPLTSSDLFQNPFLWYHENGQIKLPNGMKLDVSQSYIYRYDEESDSLDIFFSKVGESQEIDRPFIRLKFSPVDEGWLAKAYHLCGEDHYHASYLISFSGLNITKMEVVFDVLGPKKNYRSTTYFTAAGQE